MLPSVTQGVVMLPDGRVSRWGWRPIWEGGKFSCADIFYIIHPHMSSYDHIHLHFFISGLPSVSQGLAKLPSMLHGGVALKDKV